MCSLECSALRSQRQTDPLELELEVFVSTVWVLGSELRSSGRALHAHKCRSLALYKLPCLSKIFHSVDRELEAQRQQFL